MLCPFRWEDRTERDKHIRLDFSFQMCSLHDIDNTCCSLLSWIQGFQWSSDDQQKRQGLCNLACELVDDARLTVFLPHPDR